MAMKKNTSVILATIGAIAISPLFLVSPTLAEEDTTPEANQLELEESRDEFDSTQGDYDEAINPLDLIHRANLGGGRSMEDYRQDQQENFNDAAALFRARQQELLRQQRQAELGNSEPINELEVTTEAEDN